MMSRFLESKPTYSSFEDFLVDAGIPSEKVRKRPY
jgi:hypothetical protein